VNGLSRRTFVGAVAISASFSGIARAEAKDRLVIGMSLEPPVLDTTKNAAAAIRETACAISWIRGYA
jgi:peptide/nickel transport system substrate-binding protein